MPIFCLRSEPALIELPQNCHLHHGKQKEKDPKLIGFLYGCPFLLGIQSFFYIFLTPVSIFFEANNHPCFFVSDVIGTSSKILEAQIVLELNDCQAGGQFIFWVADLFALMNDKMGGDWEKGQKLMKSGMYG